MQHVVRGRGAPRLAAQPRADHGPDRSGGRRTSPRIGARRVGVVATTATGALRRVRRGDRRAQSAHARVREVAAPALVPLVEAGDRRRTGCARAVADAVARSTSRSTRSFSRARIIRCSMRSSRRFSAPASRASIRPSRRRSARDRVARRPVRCCAGAKAALRATSRAARSTRFATGVAAVVGPLGAGDTLGLRDSGLRAGPQMTWKRRKKMTTLAAPSAAPATTWRIVCALR